MIRFYNRKITLQNDIDAIMASERILAGENIWDDGKAYFRKYVSDNASDIRLLPVVNEKKEVLCHAYQDIESNRELRMLKELRSNREALQFRDIFPAIKEVLICGCNELAYCFVKYLEEQQIPVAVAGKYWDYFGYEGVVNADVDDVHKLVVYAEDVIPKTADLYQTVIRSASPAFECIDKIYETNVLQGKIKDTKGEWEEVLGRLRGKEIVILGTDVRAQDIYDLLYGHGIVIWCFARWGDTEATKLHRTLLGKKVLSVEEVIIDREDAVFIDGSDKGSALGTENVEICDYYGYERNEQFFLIQDYTEIPCIDLLHVLKGKKVFLEGDEKLCYILSGYLEEREQGNIEPVYIDLSQCRVMKETDILCIVYPWFGLASQIMEENPKVWHFMQMLSKEKIVSYTDYFSKIRTLVNVDLYRNRGKKKYSIKELTPKGILLGRIEAFSGNIFFRGILDGHPDILKWGYTYLNNNLFLYCIRLAGERSENILKIFKKLCNEEFAFCLEGEFTCWDQFERSAKTLLSLRETFTSQELFVIFHIAYAEMLCGYRITDLPQKIIYWEPHMFPRENFPFLERWLEDGQIHGQTVCVHRDMLVKVGSTYNQCQRQGRNDGQPIMNVANIVEDCTGQQWEMFHMRFEDMKLHPQKELRRLCGRLGILWSDTMLRVTDNGEAWNYQGIFDFDLKPVFNKYEEWLSEFDRFRISLTNSLYQKKYGYTYENCMNFSRRELQEMFLKEFRFQKKMRFEQEKDRTVYFLCTHRKVMNQLWEIRKHSVIDDIVPEFGEIEIGESTTKKKTKIEAADKKELDRLVGVVREMERLVLYGTGSDCKKLWNYLDEATQSKLIFSDLKA